MLPGWMGGLYRCPSFSESRLLERGKDARSALNFLQHERVDIHHRCARHLRCPEPQRSTSLVQPNRSERYRLKILHVVVGFRHPFEALIIVSWIKRLSDDRSNLGGTIHR